MVPVGCQRVDEILGAAVAVDAGSASAAQPARQDSVAAPITKLAAAEGDLSPTGRGTYERSRCDPLRDLSTRSVSRASVSSMSWPEMRVERSLSQAPGGSCAGNSTRE